MNRNEILQKLHSQMAALHREFGIQSLALFGSVAKNCAGPESDVDLLVELAPPLTFERYTQVNFYLEDLFGCPIDLVLPDTLKSRIRSSVLAEAIYVT